MKMESVVFYLTPRLKLKKQPSRKKEYHNKIVKKKTYYTYTLKQKLPQRILFSKRMCILAFRAHQFFDDKILDNPDKKINDL